MHKSFLISEQERKRILNKHSNASKSMYLNILKEQESEIKKEDVKIYFETKKKEIMEWLKTIKTDNKEDKQNEYEDKIEEINEYIEPIIAGIDESEKDKLTNMLKKIKNIYRDTIIEGVEDEINIFEKDFTITWASIVSNIINIVSKTNLSNKMNTARIAY